MQGDTSGSSSISARAEAAMKLAGRAKAELGACIFGQEEALEQSLIALLSSGHALMVGAPGLAKTRLVEALGATLGLSGKRVQFTPDLMPADILGSEVLDEAGGQRSFRFIHGPVFCELLMADEINRASPRTQSALLQAMQEKKVTVAGKDYPLPESFTVLATQNPIEHEGTYPLPEAQLDRFLLQITLGYPSREAEREVLLKTTGNHPPQPKRVADAAELMQARALVRDLPIGEAVVEKILALVRALRPETAETETVKRHVAWAPGPRAGQALMVASRARALIQGRLAPSQDDLRALALPVMRHRMALRFSARAEGLTVERVIAEICDQVLD